MITETRESRTRLLHTYERHPRRRHHHTLDNATLDQFNFICIPLHLNKSRTDLSSSQSNLIITSSNGVLIPKSKGVTSPTRRVRFKFEENHQTHSSEDVRTPKKYSIHRVEFQIPIQRDINAYLNVDCSSTPAKTRSITSKKIDINFNNTTHHPQGMSVDSSTLSTVDSDNSQTQWYKEMYGQIHKSPETKKDEQQNPYKPTYTFPEELDGDLKRMEDYIRKAASQTIDDGDRKTENRRNIPSSITNIQDRQTIPKRTHLDDQMTSSSTERTKSNNDPAVSSSITINPRSNPVPIRTPSSTTDDEQKSVYKRILRGGDIPSSGLQKFSGNNRDLRWHVESPSGFNKNRFNSTIKSSLFSDNELSQKSNDRELLESDQQKPQSRINETQPISKAFALHNFYAQTNRELSFKKGDTILVKRRINDDWLEGEYQGKTGIFPVNHVELFPHETMEGEAIVKHDFLPQKTYELQLRKGEKVILLRKLENDWYEGRLNHNEGIFPAEYVEVLREPKVEQSNQNEQVTKIPKSVLKNSTGLQQTSVEKTNVVPQLSLPMQKCQVLYDYTPQNPDELEIHVGDILSIIEMCDDGWYCGIMEKSSHDNRMTFGTFPGNYVKILPI